MTVCGLPQAAIRALRTTCRELTKRNEPNNFLRNQVLAQFRKDMYLKDPVAIAARSAIAIETAEYLQSLSEYNERLIYNRVGADHESLGHIERTAAHVGLKMPQNPFTEDKGGDK